MHYWEGLATVPTNQPPSVVTLGNFDGMHWGHHEVISELVSQANQRDAQSVAVTFDPHPRLVHMPEEPLVPIMSLPQKVDRLRQSGIDGLCVVHYTLDFAQQTPEEFVENMFVNTFNAVAVVVGRDSRFGKNNSGDINVLRKLGRKFGFDVVEVADVGRGKRWSSTWAREAITQGKVAEAAQILGRNHCVAGEVVHGHARGRELGFPTANLSAEAQGLIPADGVYAGWLYDETGRQWPAAISVGTNPTFVGVERVVEAHVINRPDGEKIEDFDLYGQFVNVEFVARIRGMVAFAGIPKLIQQMERDVQAADDILLGDAPVVDGPDNSPSKA